jgi:hypothetical protein
MNYKKPIYLVYYIVAILAILCAIFLPRAYLLYIKPYTLLGIALIYIVEHKTPISFLFLLSLCLAFIGEILIIKDFIKYFGIINILFAAYYLANTVLIYIRNRRKNTYKRLYLYATLISVLWIYVSISVIEIIYEAVINNIIELGILVLGLLIFILVALCNYLNTRNFPNLWVFIAVINLMLGNILIGLNELYMYHRMCTVIIILCQVVAQFFLLLFMLDKREEVIQIIEE